MTGLEELERAVLDENSRHFEERGYRLIREPRGSDLPAFLGRLRPDAIAVGKDPKLLIEIVHKGAPHAAEKISHLKSLIGDRDDWQLEVIYSGVGAIEIGPATTDDLTDLLERAGRLAASEPAASLLLIWAGLEAIARRLAPDRTVRPQTPGRVVELLASEGHVRPSEADILRTSIVVRNKFVHGDLSVRPSTAQVESLLRIAKVLADSIVEQDRTVRSGP